MVFFESNKIEVFNPKLNFSVHFLALLNVNVHKPIREHYSSEKLPPRVKGFEAGGFSLPLADLRALFRDAGRPRRDPGDEGDAAVRLAERGEGRQERASAVRGGRRRSVAGAETAGMI